jgi:hypothetical protein
VMYRVWIIFFSTLLTFLVSYSAQCGSFDSSSDNESEDNLTYQFILARKNNIGIIDSRPVLDNNGGWQRNQKKGYWQLNILPGNSPLPTKEQTLVEDKPGVIIIFVHGYNIPPAKALRYGNSLWELLKVANHELQKTIKDAPMSEALRFFDFLWRGDLGEIKFSESQNAAANSSVSLADFIVQLPDTDLGRGCRSICEI